MPNQVYQSTMTPYQQPQQQSFGQQQSKPNFNLMDIFKYSPGFMGTEYFSPGSTDKFSNLLSPLSSMLFGENQRIEQMQNYTPEQQSVMSQLLQQGLGGMGQFDFTPIEEQARQGFQQNTIPSIAERFTSMGGGQRSSGFQQTLGQAGAGLESNLAAMKQQYNLQRQPLFQNMMNMGLRPQFENIIHPKSSGILGGLMGGIGQGIGQMAPMALGALL